MLPILGNASTGVRGTPGMCHRTSMFVRAIRVWAGACHVGDMYRVHVSCIAGLPRVEGKNATKSIHGRRWVTITAHEEL